MIMKKDIKLIAFDIDGTLIPWGKHKVEESSVKAILSAKEKGKKIIISTGRIINFIQKSVVDDLDPDFYVCINGQIIYDKNQNILARHNIEERDIISITEECKKLKYPLAFKWEHNIVIYNLFQEFSSNYLKGEDHKDALIDNTMNNNYHCDHGNPLSVFILAPEDEIKYFNDKFPNIAFVRPKDHTIEGYNRRYNKATGIFEVAKQNGCSMENVMCFGDASNDIDMITQAKIGIAMGNASQDVKEKADYVTDRCDEDGIVKALQHFEII